MESAVEQDYKLKEGIIVKHKSTLEDIGKDLKKMALQMDTLGPRKDAIAEFYKKRSKGSDAQLLSENIKDMDNIKENVERNVAIMGAISEKLAMIQKNVGDADIPTIIKSREKEFDEFIQKLKKVEQEFFELKKQIQSRGVEGMEDDIDQIDNAVREL